MGYETEIWRRPTILEDDTVVFDEHGRSANNVNFKSHWLVLVKAQYGGYFILVKHGAGEERIPLGYGHHAGSLKALSSLTSDDRYLILYTIYKAWNNAADRSRTETTHRYQLAFLEGRLKRRKKDHHYYCDMVPKIITLEPVTT